MFIYGEKSELNPNLGFFQLTLMALSGALGAGFFVLLSRAVVIGRGLAPLAFLVSAVASFLISWVYSELAVSMPVSGGGQVYIRNAFSPHPLFFIVHWLTWLAELSFTALNALGVGFYSSLLLPVNPIVLALTFTFLMVLVNLKGIENVGKVELVTGALMLVSVSVLAIILFQHLPVRTAIISNADSVKEYFGWLSVVPLVFVIFIGNEDIAAIAAEVEDKKDIAKALTVAILGILIITILFSFLFSRIFTTRQLANNPKAFSLLGDIAGPVGRFTGIGVAILGCLGSLFFGSLADTRTAYAMAKAGEFPKVFTELNRSKVPFVSVLVNGSLVSLLVLSGSATYVAYLASAGFLIEAIFVSWALIRLRSRRPHLPRPVLANPYPLVPLAVIAIAGFFLLFVKPQAWLALIVFSGLGFLVSITSHIEKRSVYYAGLGVLLFVLLNLVISGLVIGL